MKKLNNIQVRNTCKGVTLQNKRCKITLPEGIFFCEHHKKQEGKPLDITSRKTCEALNKDGSLCGNAVSLNTYKFCFYHKDQIPLKNENKIVLVDTSKSIVDLKAISDSDRKCAAIDSNGKMCCLPHDSKYLFCRSHKDYIPGSNDHLIPKLDDLELERRYNDLPPVIEFRDKVHLKNNNTFLTLNTLEERVNYLRHIDRINIDKYNNVICKLKGCINRTGNGFDYCFFHKEYSSVGNYLKVNTPKVCKGFTVKGIACKKVLSSSSPDDYCNWHSKQKPAIVPPTLIIAHDYSSVTIDYCKDGVHKYCRGLNSFGSRCRKKLLIGDSSSYCGVHKDQASLTSNGEEGPSLRSIRESLPPFDHS